MEASRDYTIDEQGIVHIVLRNRSPGIDTKCGKNAVTISMRMAANINAGGIWCINCFAEDKKAKRQRA